MRYLLIVFILAFDQLVKYAVRTSMTVGESIPVIQDVFHLTYVQNTGAAFSLFEGRMMFLMIVPLLALLFGIWYMEKHQKEHNLLLLSLILIISGGIGNLIDRFLLGYVTDMFDFRFFPVFNIADIAICVGCFFLTLYIFCFDGKEKERAA
ncbi:MAG: signal peptidase II [Firmicutes bacterium]|nr:signal peptidase II [Bacillota bacterium]